MTNSAEFIFKESQKEFSILSDSGDENIYKIKLNTINMIEQINVNCLLVIYKIETISKNKYFIGLWIESQKIKKKNKSNYGMYFHKERLFSYNEKKINDYLLKIKNNILPNLKLDIVFGKFILMTNDGKKIIQEANIGEDIFGFEYSTNTTCSSCNKLTYTQTNCNHLVCVGCWNKINNNCCPSCNKKLIIKKGKLNNSIANEYFNDIVGDDEEDSDDEDDDEDDGYDDGEDRDDRDDGEDREYQVYEVYEEYGSGG